MYDILYSINNINYYDARNRCNMIRICKRKYLENYKYIENNEKSSLWGKSCHYILSF